MAKRTGNELLLHDRVISKVDLPRVPAGTPGKVILTSGWDHKDGRDWQRFRVLFEIGGPNGTDVGSLVQGAAAGLLAVALAAAAMRRSRVLS